jgi:thiamine-monophosphate kinase
VVSLGISARFSVEDIEALFEGIRHGCHIYGVELETGDITASINGLIIAVTAFGRVTKEHYVGIDGAQENDLVCITGDLGAAYMGLQLLEREKRVFQGNDAPQPMFAGREEILRQQLAPNARVDIVEALSDNGLLPTSMTVLNDGLAAEMLRICKQSNCGVRLYLERIPISRATREMAEELNTDYVVAALNGGDDHELMFTLPLERRDDIVKIGGVDIIGHITDVGTGTDLVLPDGTEVALSAPNM